MHPQFCPPDCFFGSFSRVHVQFLPLECIVSSVFRLHPHYFPPQCTLSFVLQSASSILSFRVHPQPLRCIFSHAVHSASSEQFLLTSPPTNHWTYFPDRIFGHIFLVTLRIFSSESCGAACNFTAFLLLPLMPVSLVILWWIPGIQWVDTRRHS